MSYLASRCRFRLRGCLTLLLALLPLAPLTAAPREADFLAYLELLTTRWQAAGPLSGETLQEALEDLGELREHARQAGFSPAARARLDALEAKLAPPAALVPKAEGEGTIQGTVREQRTGLPIAGVEIYQWRPPEYTVLRATTAADGSFQATLPPGRHFLLAKATNWASQRYHLLPCRRGNCDLASGTPIDVAAGATVTGIDFELLPAGHIVGTARRADNSAPIPYGRVQIVDPDGRSAGSVQVIDGVFASRGLPSGPYFALMENTPVEVGQVYGGGPACFAGYHNHCKPLTGTPILVEEGQDTSITFSLLAGAFISGKIFLPNGQNPNDYSSVRVLTAEDREIWSDPHLFPNSYRAGPFPPGLYAVAGHSRDYPFQLYNDQVCLGTCVFAQADPLSLSIGEEREHIDFHLHEFGSLNGRVEDRQSGAHVGRANIRLFEAATRQLLHRLTGAADGSFRLPQLAPGAYLVTAGSDLTEWRASGDIPFLPGGETAALEAATPVVVPEGDHLEMPPLRLRQLGRIRGRAVDAATGQQLDPVAARAFQQDRQNARGYYAIPGPGADFEISGLLPGTYYVVIDGPGSQDQLIGGSTACLLVGDGGTGNYTTCDPTRGRAFTVDFDQVADAGETRLPAAAAIRGRVQLQEGRAGKIYLVVFNQENRAVLNQNTLPVNAVDFDLPLPGNGTYFLYTWSPDYLAQVYSGFECTRQDFDFCIHPAQTTPIVLGAGEVRTGIDFDLRLDRQPCYPLPQRICLGNGRFSVYTEYQTSDYVHHDSVGTAISQSAGYFTFFDPANVELVVKILDACRDYDRFWVYAAGLTDLSTNLQIRDTWAAVTQRYGSSGPYRPFVDDVSFRTCAVPPPPGAAPAPPLPVATAPAPPSTLGDCGGDPATTLCLGGRFRVDIEWQTASGQRGRGNAYPLTADTGFFYFFSPDNIEVIVKTLDACGGNLNHRFWLFAAGMTDVAVTLNVKDTVTGAEKLYLSPLGSLFQPILDLEAFATCP